MWVLSQNKMTCVKVKELAVVEYDENHYEILSERGHELGNFATKEEAMKVIKDFILSIKRAEQVFYIGSKEQKEEYYRENSIAAVLNELSVRTLNGILRLGVSTIDELLTKSWEDVIKIRCFGIKSVKELHEALVKRGLNLNGNYERAVSYEMV